MPKIPGQFKVTNADTETPTMYISGYIGEDDWGDGVSYDWVASQLDAFKKAKKKSIDVRINSGGGSVHEGHGISNLFRASGIRTNMFVDGIAASIASAIAVSGSSVEMGKYSRIMIHEARGFGGGTALELRKFADEVESINNDLADLYAKKTGGSADEYRQLMAETTYFTPSQAMERGLADSIGEYGVAASLDMAIAARLGFKNIPEDLLHPPAGEPTDDSELFNQIDNAIERLRSDGEVE